MSRLIAEILPVPIQRAIKSSTGLKMLTVTCRPDTAPEKRKTNTFANSVIASMPAKDFLGMTIACDTFGYGTEKDRTAARAAVWTSTSKMSESENYMTVCPALVWLTTSAFGFGGWRRVLLPRVSNNTFGP